MIRLLTLLVFTISGLNALSQSGKIYGKITDITSNEVLPFAKIQIQNEVIGAISDLDGNYTISSLEPGLYNLECSMPGYKKSTRLEIEVTNDRPAEINFQLELLATETQAIEIVASSISNVEESPISVRTIGTNEIKRNPGGNRDISRAIRSLPGVAAIPSFRNDIIIRGGAANENRFYIDGIEIPNINHFATQGASGGPVGLINVDLIREVEFYSGAFPTARGNALSSVLEFGFKDARKDKATANFVVGSSDIGVTIESPTGKNSGIVFSARRSYLQGLFSVLGLPFLPTYNDYNLKWKWDINEKNKLTIISLGALDQFQLNLKLASDSTSEDFLSNKYLLDNLPINEQWNYSIGAKWDRYGEKGRTSFIVSRNMLNNAAFKYENNDESLAKTLDYSSVEAENKFRVEHKLNLKNGWKLLIGGGGEYARFSLDNRAFFFNNLLDTTFEVRQSSFLEVYKYSSFVQSSKEFFSNRLVVSAGIRMDGADFNSSMANAFNQLSPRISFKYRLAPQWSLNANTGIYYQLPSYTILGFEENGSLQNKDAQYIRNQQIVGGVEYEWLSRNALVSIEGFYKGYDQYPLSVAKGISLANLGADFGVIGNERIVFDGKGRAYGIEFLLQQKFYNGWYGIASYTFVRSEFTQFTGDYTPSSWDSRHLVSLTGGKKLKRNWEIGGRFQLSGGLPYTPDNVQASMLIANWDRFGGAITDWGQVNSKRFSAFHQLDVRIDKKWFFEKWSLDLFLDIQNIYNQQTTLKPLLDVLRDPQGNPIVDPNNSSSYIPNSLTNTNGTLLPSIGLIIEL